MADDVRSAEEAFYREALLRREECEETDDSGEGDELSIVRVKKSLVDLVEWISDEVDTRYEWIIDVIFDFGIEAFLNDMRDREGWLCKKKNYMIRHPEKLAEMKAKFTELQRRRRRR
jgi:hypothetical protein